MKTRLLCVALLLGTTSIVRADEIADLKAATQKLAKQNQELAAKLAAVEKRQRKTEAKVDTKKPVLSADASAAPAGYGAAGQWAAADLARHIVNPADDHSLTFFGITLYGNIDGGVGYQSHTTPLSPSWGNGLNYLIGKGSYNGAFQGAPNALSNTAVGIKINQPVAPGFSVVGQIEEQFQPFSGQIQNGPASLAQANGHPNGTAGSGSYLPGTQTGVAASDSSKAGNLSQLWGGLSNPVYGTLTFGRQYNLTTEQTNAYDPIPGGGTAFTLLGNSGTYGSGFQSTELARLDDSFKYKVNVGPIRVAAAYKFDQHGQSGSGQVVQGGAGFDYKDFSFDATGGKAYNAFVSVNSLSASEIASANAFAVNQGNGLVDASLADVTEFELTAKYVTGPFKFFAGYNYVRLENPSNPYTGATGSTTGPATNGYVEGGYGIYTLNNSPFYTAKVVQTAWLGGRYAVRPDFDIDVAYYRAFQGTYAKSAATFTATVAGGRYGCNGSQQSNCSGYLDAVSLLLDYHWTKRVDLYAGVLWSDVHGGLANGYAAAGNIVNTTTYGPAGNIAPTAGLRYQF